MYVYFVQGEGGGPVKIGIAQTPESRLKQLQSCSPVILKFIGLMKGDRKLENDLHIRFGAYRLHGEWFSPNDELLSLAADNPFPALLGACIQPPSREEYKEQTVVDRREAGATYAEIGKELSLSRQRVFQIYKENT